MNYTASIYIYGEALNHFWIKEKLGNTLQIGEEFVLPNDNVLYVVERKMINYYVGKPSNVKYIVKEICRI